jgi:hypothetical protein
MSGTKSPQTRPAEVHVDYTNSPIDISFRIGELSAATRALEGRLSAAEARVENLRDQVHSHDKKLYAAALIAAVLGAALSYLVPAVLSHLIDVLNHK